MYSDGYEVAVSYFRAGYGPEDYPTHKVNTNQLFIVYLHDA